MAVLLDFLLQITAFVALVTLDFERAKDNRIDCFPCIKLNPYSVEQTEGTYKLFAHGYFGFLLDIIAPLKSASHRLCFWAVVS